MGVHRMGNSRQGLGDACLWSNKLGFNHLFGVVLLFESI